MILSRNDVLSKLAPRNLGLVFGCDVRRGDGRTIDETERQEESDTHRTLRDALVLFCGKLAIGIYPHNIGRRGRYAMADALLCVAEAAPLFIEILASPQAMTPENIERKRALSSPEAPLRFLVTGFDYDSLIGYGDGPGWSADVAIEDKHDILRTGQLESPLTMRGTRRKRRRWIYTPTIWKFLREHFRLPAPPPLGSPVLRGR